jgi:hypothetical protein
MGILRFPAESGYRPLVYGRNVLGLIRGQTTRTLNSFMLFVSSGEALSVENRGDRYEICRTRSCHLHPERAEGGSEPITGQ